ncbi:hypothetical protein BJF91_19980 [Allorhizobium taibaishanense]|uniref:Uncharacterized protein n=1 Tax=Allorhizobium taibaishanense TaxID=887144 RepID=A0A1Q9A430_9HYPH|nr:hypothetical protein BJF91_19980 [Allorhizobium taibaishanense]
MLFNERKMKTYIQVSLMLLLFFGFSYKMLHIEFPGSTVIYLTILLNTFICTILLYRRKP